MGLARGSLGVRDVRNAVELRAYISDTQVIIPCLKGILCVAVGITPTARSASSV